MSASAFKAALIQTTSGNDVSGNIETVSAAVREARGAGAEFILTPETVSLMEQRSELLFERVFEEDEDPALKAFRELAAELGVWLLLGSLIIKTGGDKLANRSFLLDSAGAIAARYDKIHLFDVDLPGGESYRESRNFVPGDAAATAETPWGRLGMSVCYDLRFAALYRGLARAGAAILTVPAAFTRTTGQAHWHVLLRARAIETGCYVLAPAQCGTHADGRETFGHSLAVDPWGEVLADGGEAPGITLAEIDPAKVEEARGRIPSLQHGRDFSAP